MKWTQKEDTILKSKYKTHTCSELAKELKRSESSVKGRIRTLGIKKKEIVSKPSIGFETLGIFSDLLAIVSDIVSIFDWTD